MASSSSSMSLPAMQTLYTGTYNKDNKQHKFTVKSSTALTQPQIDALFEKSYAASKEVNPSAQKTKIEYHLINDSLTINRVRIDGMNHSPNPFSQPLVLQGFPASAAALSTSIKPAPTQAPPPQAKRAPLLDLLKDRASYAVNTGTSLLDALASQFAVREKKSPDRQTIETQKRKITEQIANKAKTEGMKSDPLRNDIYNSLKSAPDFAAKMNNFRKSSLCSKATNDEKHAYVMRELNRILRSSTPPQSAKDKALMLAAYAHYIQQPGAAQGDLFYKLFRISYPNTQIVIVEENGSLHKKSNNISNEVTLDKCLFLQRSSNEEYRSFDRKQDNGQGAIDNKFKKTLEIESNEALTVGRIKKDKRTSLTNAISENIFGYSGEAATQKSRAELLRDLAASNIKNQYLECDQTFTDKIIKALKTPETIAALKLFGNDQAFGGATVSEILTIIAKHKSQMTLNDRLKLSYFYHGYLLHASTPPLGDAFLYALQFAPNDKFRKKLQDLGAKSDFCNGIRVVKITNGADKHTLAVDPSAKDIRTKNTVFVWFDNVDLYDVLTPNSPELQKAVAAKDNSLRKLFEQNLQATQKAEKDMAFTRSVTTDSGAMPSAKNKSVPMDLGDTEPLLEEGSSFFADFDASKLATPFELKMENEKPAARSSGLKTVEDKIMLDSEMPHFDPLDDGKSNPFPVRTSPEEEAPAQRQAEQQRKANSEWRVLYEQRGYSTSSAPGRKFTQTAEQRMISDERTAAVERKRKKMAGLSKNSSL